MNTFAPHGGPLALAADDDRDILALLESQLRRAGFDVFTAADGETALELALTHRFDVALLDIKMPGLDGFEVTRRIRASAGGDHVHITLISASVEESNLRLGIAAGADGHIQKPFSPRLLRERLVCVAHSSREPALV